METDKLIKLIDWAKENGTIINDSIEFKVDKSNGVYATLCNPDKIKRLNGEKLISVPSAILITKKLALESFDSKINDKTVPNPNALTQLYLCQLKFQIENQSQSLATKQAFFKTYLDLLPNSLNHPYFWPLDKLELLKKTDLYITVKHTLTSLFKEWSEILNVCDVKPYEKDENTINKLIGTELDLNEQETFKVVFQYIQDSVKLFLEDASAIHWNSFFAYLWSFCIFNSRAFPEIMLNSKDITNINQAFLMPIMDLLNHKNNTKVKWIFSEEDQKVDFFTNVENFTNKKENPNNELYNNYGDKSNEELLLGYGFVEESNNFDFCRLTLKLEDQLLKDAKFKQGIKLTDENLIAPGCVQFKLSMNESLPTSLLKLFGFLCKLKSEDKIPYRALLEGSDELRGILESKLNSIKELIKELKGADNVIQILKSYLVSQRRIMNQTMETLASKQKSIVKSVPQQNMISFKTIFKSDKMFANAMLLRFGVIKFEDLISKDVMNKALMLWIVRAANKDALPKKLEYTVPQFILVMFKEVADNIVVQKEDVMEYMSFYKELFPHLSQKLPEVFSKGEWGIKQFIIADTVIDRIVWIKKNNNEPIFLKQSFEDE
ncbi:hypothetical protein C6P45_001405 [Maudiozyma exigua]|uniref:SET domain-containing protein n=1 Tax=Maudiozyma exigua TaxID=34358 RepID=A0A9P7B5U1_MAUEX|nr:hypothetical protein C6P45_001405 [Kazachstania exigua]